MNHWVKLLFLNKCCPNPLAKYLENALLLCVLFVNESENGDIDC